MLQKNREHRNTLSQIIKKRRKLFTVILIVLLICEVFLFTYTYQYLHRSIQKERIDSAQQISVLISEKLHLLREQYKSELKQSAQTLIHTKASSLEEVNDLLINDKDVYLLKENGAVVSTRGEPIVISTTKLLQDLNKSEEICSEFTTVQTKGDFWLFGIQLDQMNIDGENIIGLLKLVDAQEYANVMAVSVFEGQGASYVVDQNGVIVLRPTNAKVNAYFQGYNMLNILENASVAKDEIEVLSKALRDHQRAEVSVTIKDNTWLLQCFPDDEDRNIVMTIPISITAHETFRGMRNVIIVVTIILCTSSMLFLIWIFYYINRDQKLKLESAKATLKSDFMSKMSHDIRTPLNAIIGMHDLALQSIEDPNVVQDCLEKAKKSSEYLVSIINDVLDISRIESGKMMIQTKAFSMQEVLDTMMQIEELPAKERGIGLVLHCKTTPTTGYLGDTVRIKQCLMNLISNAIKFTQVGGAVVLGYDEFDKEDQSWVRFTITDNGVGMSEEFMERMFKPFEQEQSSRTSTTIGSGLGLAIVHNLVELMEGNIQVESKLHQGTTFTIELPLKRVEAQELEHKEEKDLELQVSGKRILLAEDNELNCEIITHVLEGFGLQVDIASNGAQAVELYQGANAKYYAMIFMDIQMPVMNGLQASVTIRQLEKEDSQTIPIIALSANAFEEDVENSIQHGMQAHLTKPIDVKHIKQILMEYIDK